MPSLFIDIEARYAKFRDGLSAVVRESEKAGKRVSKAFSAVSSLLGPLGSLSGVLASISGAVSVGALAAVTREIADQADALGKLSQQTGDSVEQLSKLQYAASLGDASAEDLDTALRTLAKNMADTAIGTGRAIKAFEALGLTQDIQAGKFKTAGELFVVLADRLSQYADGANKSAIAQKLLGDSGAKLIPTLNAGAAGIREMGDELERMGGVITGDLARQSEQFNDNITRLAAGFNALKVELAGPLIGYLADLTEEMREAIRVAGGYAEAIELVIGGRSPLEIISDSFKTTAERLRDTRGEIAGLEAQLKRLDQLDPKLFGSVFPGTKAGTQRDLQERLELLRRQKQLLEGAQRREAPEGLDSPFERRLLRSEEKPQAPGLVDPGKTKSRTADTLRLQLDAFRDVVAEEQKLLSERNALFEQYNRDNLLSLRQYYEGRSALQQGALESTLRAYDAEIEALQSRLAVTKDQKERTDLEGKISDAVGRRADAERAAAVQASTDWFEQQRAAQAYEDQLQEITARLADLRGETDVSVVIRFDAQNADILQRLRTEAADAGNAPEARARAAQALEELAALRTLTEKRAQANALQTEAEDVLRRLDVAERRLASDREAGAVTELGQLKQLGELRGQSLQQLEEIGAKLREIALGSGDERLIQDAEEFDARLQELSASADVLGKKFDAVFTDAFGNAFADVISGTKSVKDAFNDMASSIVQAVNRIIAQEIAESLFKGLFKGGGGGSGFFDLVGSLFSASGNAFAPAGPVAAFASGGAFGAGEVLTQPTAFRFAAGGAFRTGIAGEAGPEGALPLKRMPDGKLGVYAEGAGAVTVQINVQGVQDEGTLRRSAAGVAAAAARAVSRGRRNN